MRLETVRVNQGALSFLGGQNRKAVFIEEIAAPAVFDGGGRGFRSAGRLKNPDRSFAGEQEVVIKHYVIGFFGQAPFLPAAPHIRLFMVSARALERFSGHPFFAVDAYDCNFHASNIPQKIRAGNHFCRGSRISKNPQDAPIRPSSIVYITFLVGDKFKRFLKPFKRCFWAVAALPRTFSNFVFGPLGEGELYA